MMIALAKDMARSTTDISDVLLERWLELRCCFSVYSSLTLLSTYKLGYVKHGSTAFKVPKDGCGVPRALLGPEGLLMR